MLRCMGRALIAAIVGLALLAPAARGDIEIRDSDSTALLDSFEKANCKTHKRGPFGFTAFSLPAGDTATVDVFISQQAWKGFGHTYPLYYGDQHVQVNAFYGGQEFGAEHGIPGTPPGIVGAGGVKISKNGKRFSVGAYALSNEDFTAGVSVSGGAKCKYPRRR